MAEPCHSIRVVAKKTGLTPHVIRIWEKRYGAVEPARTDSNRRLYSEEEIERLTLLREATAAGHSIGNVAKLDSNQLRKLIQESLPHVGGVQSVTRSNGSHGAVVELEERCLAAIQRMDSRELESLLEKSLLMLGHQGMLRALIGPLAQRLGQMWRTGEVTAAHEHFATAILRVFLGNHSKPFSLGPVAPCMVVATPVGQLHELGAVMVGAAATNLGWRVVYLGASLPASEIASVAAAQRARVVALSIVYPEDDPGLGDELEALRKYLPDETAILVGGRAVEAYKKELDRIDAMMATDLESLALVLDKLRMSRPPDKAPQHGENGLANRRAPRSVSA